MPGIADLLYLGQPDPASSSRRCSLGSSSRQQPPPGAAPPGAPPPFSRGLPTPPLPLPAPAQPPTQPLALRRRPARRRSRRRSSRRPTWRRATSSSPTRRTSCRSTCRCSSAAGDGRVQSRPRADRRQPHPALDAPAHHGEPDRRRGRRGHDSRQPDVALPGPDPDGGAAGDAGAGARHRHKARPAAGDARATILAGRGPDLVKSMEPTDQQRNIQWEHDQFIKSGGSEEDWQKNYLPLIITGGIPGATARHPHDECEPSRNGRRPGQPGQAAARLSDRRRRSGSSTTPT